MPIEAGLSYSDREPYDVEKTPIWALPQLRKLETFSGLTIIGLTRLVTSTKESTIEIFVRIKDEGYYYGIIRKSGMKDCPTPAIYFERH